ncbi:glycosyltransferase family 2 protein [Candidatus Woesebacteria bacterium]|nr:MAG: glycosyltransferase family 2 protein [Candidatus Woesebacteria bacterium]
MELSIILPIHNEESNINPLYDRLSLVLKKLKVNYDLVFINDGSTDDSLNKLLALRNKDKRVKIINFSRNFGHMSAVTAGLRNAQGDKVVIMDCDLQDPPEVIPQLYKKSKDHDVVYAIKEKRKEGLVKRAMFSLFYIIQTHIADLPIPANAGTFSILDKKVVKIIDTLPEKNKFFSGLRVWVGFKQGSITYERAARLSGEKNSLKKLVKLAFDGLFSFSYVPLRIASILGILFALIAFVLVIIVGVLRIFFDWGIVGWASTLTTILFIGGVQLITLGIIGEYLARIYDEVKNRPEYIIQDKHGFDK